mmetsp:Transcript_19292/g.44933  ORF Transcript_19292/g.44933 Transcript_19292/m.44933 type:complete len:93 (-) Transcript_19292:182-460(-)
MNHKHLSRATCVKNRHSNRPVTCNAKHPNRCPTNANGTPTNECAKILGRTIDMYQQSATPLSLCPVLLETAVKVVAVAVAVDEEENIQSLPG